MRLSRLGGLLGGSAPPQIEFVGIGARAEKTSASPITVPYPSGIQAGDILVLCLVKNSTCVITTPSGWTVDNSDSYKYMAHVIYSGSGTSVTFAMSTSYSVVIARILAFRSVNNTSPINASSAAIDTTPMTTTVAGTMLIALVRLNTRNKGTSNVTAWTWSASPTLAEVEDYSRSYSSGNGTTSRTGIAIAYGLMPTVGNTGTLALTHTAINYSAFAIAIAPV